jgi:hypothetical protein
MFSLLDSNGADYTILDKKYNDSKTGFRRPEEDGNPV